LRPFLDHATNMLIPTYQLLHITIRLPEDANLKT
jgi:hypothetical protein